MQVKLCLPEYVHLPLMSPANELSSKLLNGAYIGDDIRKCYRGKGDTRSLNSWYPP